MPNLVSNLSESYLLSGIFVSVTHCSFCYLLHFVYLIITHVFREAVFFTDSTFIDLGSFFRYMTVYRNGTIELISPLDYELQPVVEGTVVIQNRPANSTFFKKISRKYYPT